jgi:hypothetical protein
MQNCVTKGSDSKNRIYNYESDFAFHNSRKVLEKTLKLDKLLHLQSQVHSFGGELIVSFLAQLRIGTLINIATPLSLRNMQSIKDMSAKRNK